jgi:hypothetical protein
LMTSCTSGTLRSLWSVWFDTYHGAFAISRRILDWKSWMMCIFVLLAQPHNSQPYIQIGLRTEIYLGRRIIRYENSMCASSIGITQRIFRTASNIRLPVHLHSSLRNQWYQKNLRALKFVFKWQCQVTMKMAVLYRIDSTNFIYISTFSMLL